MSQAYKFETGNKIIHITILNLKIIINNSEPK